MKLSADCSEDQAILMESAKYGRMRIGKCVKMDLGYLGCQNSVLHLMDRWCSGLQRCHVQVSNPDLDNANTNCVADLNSYLEVDFSCIPGKLRTELEIFKLKLQGFLENITFKGISLQ